MIAAGGARDHGMMSRCPFTPTQWQELEHQALIFKYMVSGAPIPPELIYSIKRSLDSSLASRLFPPQHVGWSCYQLGFGRKADPEPGRCRRTDGKKWRCSKEAYPDSKYCERHMHRGRNRSRKPVEAALITSSSSPTTSLTAAAATNPCSSVNRKLSINSSPNSSPYVFSPLSSCFSAQLQAANQDTSNQKSVNNISHSHMIPFLNPQSSSSSSRPLGSSGLLTHDNLSAHHLFLDSGSCSRTDKDYSSYNFQGIRESAAAVDERTFFPEASESLRSFQGSCHPPLVTIDSSYNKAAYNNSHHHPQFQSISDCSQQQQQQQQHCFVLGSDFKPSAAAEAEAGRQVVKVEKDDKTPKSQPLHQFFGEWPPKNTDSWLDLSSTNSRIQSDV